MKQETKNKIAKVLAVVLGGVVLFLSGLVVGGKVQRRS